MNLKLHIAWLYPDLMSTYGDRGNVITLQNRAEWRGIKTQVVPITIETPIKKLEECDLIFMGGAQYRQQQIASSDFLKCKSPVIKKMIERDIPALFVCAAYQFAGHYYQPYQGERIMGGGILDLYTVHPGDQAKRLIGNVTAILDSKFKIQDSKFNTIVGFENHGGRTYLGEKTKPLAKIKRGFGNNGEDGYEGAIYKNVIGSYFHGPLLPKNPILADWLLEKALQIRYNKEIILLQLDDTLESQAHNAMLAR